ncbi:hypothetical protein PYW08_012803 [Mythimna loreyi]|uniref:Uncharacterized protein n=1 Tax=Mythimna loreyi TaxID=667449 RepID=A0ACC2Q229_9NEOP|nr:hypothetical protein PYW08_012803 [Mythimna loreyi]
MDGLVDGDPIVTMDELNENASLTIIKEKIKKFLNYILAGVAIFAMILIIAGLASRNKLVPYEIVQDYTDCTNTNLDIPDSFGHGLGPPKQMRDCICTIKLEVKRPMMAPVTAFYELEAYNQLASQNPPSRDNDQLAGHLSLEPSESCGSYTYACMDKKARMKPIAPCGGLADAMFNDTFILKTDDTYWYSPAIPTFHDGLISEDDKKPFKNPDPAGNLEEAFHNFSKPMNWQKNVWELDTRNPDNNGFQNEHFIIWMKTDLKRKPIWRVDHTWKLYNEGLPAGKYILRVEYAYPTPRFGGRRKFILSSSHGYEVVKDYTDCIKIDTETTKCKDYVGNNGGYCSCHVGVEINTLMKAPVTAYYELDAYDQIVGSYSKSRDDNQLAGHLSLEPSESCGSYTYACMTTQLMRVVESDFSSSIREFAKPSSRKPIAPCGLLADAMSMFNDTFNLDANNEPVPYSSYGLISEDEKKQFQNPEPAGNLSEAFKNFAKPMSWKKNVWELDPSNPDNNGFRNEQFIIWMKTDLKRKPVWRVKHTGRYETGLPAGSYTLRVTYGSSNNYGGQRKFILSSTTLSTNIDLSTNLPNAITSLYYLYISIIITHSASTSSRTQGHYYYNNVIYIQYYNSINYHQQKAQNLNQVIVSRKHEDFNHHT